MTEAGTGGGAVVRSARPRILSSCSNLTRSGCITPLRLPPVMSPRSRFSLRAGAPIHPKRSRLPRAAASFNTALHPTPPASLARRSGRG